MSPSTKRRCPVCHADKAGPWLTKESLQIVRCGSCSMLYANPVPAQYEGQYYEAASSYYLSPEKLQGDYSETRFVRETKLFRRYCKGGRVLDVGCSTGAFLFHLNRLYPGDYVTVGTDVSTTSLEHAASRGVRTVSVPFTDFQLENEPFDAVTFWAVVEHLMEPSAFVEKAASLLKEGGLCFVLVPNMRSLAVRLLGKRYRYILPEHVNYFTADTLQRLLEPQFETVGLFYTHFNPLVIAQDFRSGGRTATSEQRAKLLSKTTAYKSNPLLKPVKLAYGLAENLLGSAGLADNIVLVARKRPFQR